MLDPLDSLRAEVQALEAAGLRRSTRVVQSAQGPRVIVEGRTVANFCSNDYLGLAASPVLVEAARRGLGRGVGAGAARLITGSVEAHEQLERELSSWLVADRALLFNSGYQANVGVVSALVGPEDAVFSDALNHASLIDGCRLSRAQVHVYPHLDYDRLDASLRGSTARRKLVLSESLFSMDGDRSDVRRLRAISRNHGALLVLDEAHAIGCFGESGRGCAESTDADAVVGTLGKAFGSFGAYVAGAAALVDLVVQRARSFIFSTALPGALSAASLVALDIIRGEDGARRRVALGQRIAQLGVGLARLGIASTGTHIQPLLVRDGSPGSALELAAALYNDGLLAQAIRPPTVPRGTSRLRVTLRADHAPEQIELLLSQLERHRHLLSPSTP